MDEKVTNEMAKGGNRKCNLVIIPRGRGYLRDLTDFNRMATYVKELNPNIRPFVLRDERSDVRFVQPFWRPTMVFSPEILNRFRCLRGKTFQGRSLAKSEECRALEQHGIPVPNWALLTPEQRPDLSEFGPYVVVKPEYGFQGADVRIKRKGRVRWTAPRTKVAARSKNWLVQDFIYTGKWPVSYRVLVLFGKALYSWRTEADNSRRPLLEPYGFKGGAEGGGLSIVSSAIGCRFTLNNDPDIISLAEKAQQAFPDIPLLGVDIIRDQTTGDLFVIEVNAEGYVWHFSSLIGVRIQKYAGFSLEAQFDGIRKAARILACNTLLHAS